MRSPTDHSAADFTKAFSRLGITVALITDELKEVRKQYWAWIKAHAKK